MRGPRLIVLAGVVAASLTAPTALLAEEPAATGVAGGVGPAPGAQAPQKPLDQAGAAAAGAGIAAGVEAEPGSPAPAPLAVAQGVEVTAASAPRASVSAAAASVSIVNYAYKPKKVTINAGETVKWTNNDNDVAEGHTVTAVSGGSFDSGILKAGKSYSYKFSSAGTFNYFCTLHPSMEGKVVVRSSGAGGGDGSGDATSDQGGVGPTSGPSPPTDSGATSATDSTSTLPLTGQDLIAIALVGLNLLLAGTWLSLRRRSAG